MLPWIYLFLAAIAEALFGIGLHHSRGFSVFWPAVLAVVAGTLTTIWLGMAMKSLPIGVSMVVWSGAATLATVVYGIFALGEPRDVARLFFMALTVGGMAGLKVTSAS